MEKLLQLGEKLGLQGKELREFVIEREKIERDERAAQREAQKAEAEAQKAGKLAEAEAQKAEAEAQKAEAEAQKAGKLAEAEAQKAEAEAQKEAEKEKADVEKARLQVEQRKNDQEFELQKEKLRLEHERELAKTQMTSKDDEQSHNDINLPDLPIFEDGKDSMDAFLERFERMAAIRKWDKGRWAIVLSALLSGRALETYARLSLSEASDYNTVKLALLSQYSLTEEGFRLKFRDSRPIETESANQFLTRITAYMDRWTEMANVRDFESLKRLIIREQFLNVCPKKLAVHLTERPHEDVESMVMQADRYLEAHRQKLSMDNCNKDDNEDKRDKHMRVEQRQHKECSNCKRVGHTIEQRRHRGGGNEQICTRCHMYGHSIDTCRKVMEFGGALRTGQTKKQQDERSTPNKKMNISPHNTNKPTTDNQIQLVTGKVNGQLVTMLRDSGCSTVCVNRNLVSPRQLTGGFKYCKLMDGSTRRFEIAIVNLGTPYLKQDRASVLCIDNPEFDLVVGEIPGVRCKCNPDPEWRHGVC